MAMQCPWNDLLLSMLSSVYCSLHYILPSLASTSVILRHGIPCGLALSAVSAVHSAGCCLARHPAVVAIHLTCATTPTSIIPSLLCLLQRGHCVWAWSTALHHGLLLLAAHTPAVLCSPTSYTVHRGCWHTLLAATHCHAVLCYALSCCCRGCCIRSPGGMRPGVLSTALLLVLLSLLSCCARSPVLCYRGPSLYMHCSLLSLLWHASYVCALLLSLGDSTVSGRTCGCMGPCCTHCCAIHSASYDTPHLLLVRLRCRLGTLSWLPVLLSCPYTLSITAHATCSRWMLAVVCCSPSYWCVSPHFTRGYAWAMRWAHVAARVLSKACMGCASARAQHPVWARHAWAMRASAAASAARHA